MMRKILFITGSVAMALAIVSCGGPRRNPGHVYMPDMAYSRAYETYAAYDTTVFTTERKGWGSGEKSKIFYSHQPVPGTIARGEMGVHTAIADTTGGFAKWLPVRNPLADASATINMKEAERLYLVNCAICHGSKLDGNGPLYKDGAGPFPVAPRNLLDAYTKALSDGTMFFSVTYGKGQMGSYASQLSSKQRWEIITYIRTKQGGGAASDTASMAKQAGTASGDTTAATNK